MEIRNDLLPLQVNYNSSLNERHAVVPQMPSFHSNYMSSEASMASRAYAAPQMSFGNKWNKVISELQSSRPDKIKLSFEEISTLLERMGFISRGGHGGSHIVFVKQGINPILIVKPHGHHSYVDSHDVRKVQQALAS